MRPSIFDQRRQELAEKWLRNTISREEQEEFAQWYNSDQENDFIVPESFSTNEEELKNRIFTKISQQIPKSPSAKYYRIWYAAAAIILLILTSALYFYSDRSQKNLLGSNSSQLRQVLTTPSKGTRKVDEETREIIKDIPAAIDKAILTLGDGTRIILDDAQNGVLAQQGGTRILKTSEGELIYSFSDSNPEAQASNSRETISFNTIETPKGGKFQVSLPDGSKVWLNVASSLKFPAKFSGTKREVQLTGEAYFEVAHDPLRVFEVATSTQTVHVLGTHFNINAYPDEPSVNTTLLEGSVKVSDRRTNKVQLLKPGEQAKLADDLKIIHVPNAAEAVAWKEGYFQFFESDIETVMRQIGRWYDVAVRYEGPVPNQRFGGEIERSLSLLQVLKILEKSNVHFRLEGREVIVMP